jgi:hypothetical protein
MKIEKEKKGEEEERRRKGRAEERIKTVEQEKTSCERDGG